MLLERGVRILSVFRIIVAGCLIGRIIHLCFDVDFDEEWILYIVIGYFAIEIICNVFLFLAVQKENKWFIWPQFVFYGLFITVCKSNYIVIFATLPLIKCYSSCDSLWSWSLLQVQGKIPNISGPLFKLLP